MTTTSRKAKPPNLSTKAREGERVSPTKPVIAPYFSFVRASWMACVVEWDSETGEFRRLEGFQPFASYREALQASRLLKLGSPGADHVVSIEEAR